MLFCAQQLVTGEYLIDDSIGLGRRFDGIGGLSGGGVSNNHVSCVCPVRYV